MLWSLELLLWFKLLLLTPWKESAFFLLGAYKIDCFLLCTGLCWDKFHNLVFVFGDCVDVEISSFSHQP